MSTIIAAIDFSDASAAVLEASDGAEPLLLLHVAPDDPDFIALRVAPPDERMRAAEQLQKARARLRELAEQFRAAGHEVETLVVQGDPAERILDEAERRRSRLIIVGRHRHGRVHDRLVGTVAESVIRRATCPVLVVPMLA